MNVTLAGVGMGGPSGMTAAAAEALAEADAIIGAARLLDGLPDTLAARKIAEAIPEKVAEAVGSLRDCEKVCVVLSGDSGFYSGAKKLALLLSGHALRILPGISSPQYLAARLGRPWQDFRLVSAHGVDCDILAEVLSHPSVLFLTGNNCPPEAILAVLRDAGLGDAAVTVGENLSYPEERIVRGTADELLREPSFAPLSVVLVDNRKTFARDVISPGIADGEFVRGPAPMTKREVRVQALSLLELRRDSVVYDVGAGTGSVAVEAALLARRGRVYAVECEADAHGLILENRVTFGTYNLVPVLGRAPEALADLPRPDAVFVGGTRGSMREILETALAKNDRVRIVVSAIALETLSAALDAMTSLSVRNLDVVQVAAARAVVRGKYHMMEGGNPVFLISGGGRDDAD